MASLIAELFSGKGLKTPRGSLRRLRVSSPLLVMVAATFKFSDSSALMLGAEVLTVKPGAAETAITETTRAKRGARKEEDITMQMVKAVDGTTPMGP